MIRHLYSSDGSREDAVTYVLEICVQLSLYD